MVSGCISICEESVPHCDAGKGQAKTFIGCDDWLLEQILLFAGQFPDLSQQKASASSSGDLHDIFPAD